MLLPTCPELHCWHHGETTRYRCCECGELADRVVWPTTSTVDRGTGVMS